MSEQIQTPNAPQAIGPYSQALRNSDLLFVSGQIPLDKDGQMINGSVQEQTEQVMRNLQAILSSAGLTFKNVLKSEIFLTKIEDFAQVNEIYAKYMHKPYPARSTVVVKELPKGAQLEIAMIAGY